MLYPSSFVQSVLPSPQPHESFSDCLYLFNSYYQHVGARWERPKRGNLSRPTVQDVYAYRAAIDARMVQLIDRVDAGQWPAVYDRILLGLHHEQQHQELHGSSGCASR
jgi:hypothetical protein